MVYKRKWHYQYENNRNTPTKVSLHWSQKASAYSIQFHNTYHWNEMQPFINYFKQLPYGEKDTTGPPDWIWFFHEKYLVSVQGMLKVMEDANIFEVDFQDKPVGQSFTSTFVPLEVYFDKFLKLTGEDIKDSDYARAKKIYRHACLRLHPDKGGDPQDMASLNEVWTYLELNHYKEKKEIIYASEV